MRSNGGTGDGIDIGQSERGNLAHKLSLETIFKSLGTEARSFGESCITDGDGRDGAGSIQLDGHGHGASEALSGGVQTIHRSSGSFNFGYSGNSFGFFTVNLSVDLFKSAQYSIGGNGSTGDGINILRLNREGLADELCLEGIFLSLCTKTGRFSKLVVAN